MVNVGVEEKCSCSFIFALETGAPVDVRAALLSLFFAIFGNLKMESAKKENR